MFNCIYIHKGLLLPSFAYICIIIYKFLRIAYIVYTTSVNMNFFSYKYHAFLHLVLHFSVQRVVNKFKAWYLNLLHN